MQREVWEQHQSLCPMDNVQTLQGKRTFSRFDKRYLNFNF